jgi:hypothetical protein
MELTESDLFPGTRFRTYQGTGSLIVDCGNERLSQSCEFVCAQMTDGRLICHCFFSEGPLNSWELRWCEQREGAFHLHGRSKDNSPMSAHCLRYTNFASPVTYEGRSYRNFASFEAQQIHAGLQMLERADRLRFFLVNLTWDLHGAKWGRGELTVQVDRDQEYDRVVRLLKAVGGVGVTAVALVSAPRGTDILEAATVLDDEFCVLLSLARGNLVQWIAFEAFDTSGQPLAWRHRHPVTKPFSPYNFVAQSDTPDFLAQALPGLSALDERWQFWKAVLSLVDAVVTTDFLEARGLKAAVILDFLCGQFREVTGQRTLLTTSLFERWTKAVKPCIRQLTGELLGKTGAGSQPALVDEVLKHLPAFNHYTFATSLDHLLQHLKLDVDPGAVRRLVKIRNKLVHEVQYPSRRRGTKALLDEYHFAATLRSPNSPGARPIHRPLQRLDPT